MKIRQMLTTLLIGGAFISLSAMAAPETPAQTAPSTTVTSFTPEQIKDIQQIVHDYLVNNPQVLVEASQALQKQTESQEEAFAQKAIQQNTKSLFNDPASPVAGNPNGTVTVVEFFDYQCGHCKAMNSIVQGVVKKNANLRIVFKELPIFGDASQFAAKVALASVKQGKYYALHDALLSTDNPLTQAKVFQAAKSVGLNVEQLKKDMNSPAIQQQLRDNFKLAQALHLIGTPTFVIGNKALTQFRFVPGATSAENLQSLIDQLK